MPFPNQSTVFSACMRSFLKCLTISKLVLYHTSFHDPLDYKISPTPCHPSHSSLPNLPLPPMPQISWWVFFVSGWTPFFGELPSNFNVSYMRINLCYNAYRHMYSYLAAHLYLLGLTPHVEVKKNSLMSIFDIWNHPKFLVLP